MSGPPDPKPAKTKKKPRRRVDPDAFARARVSTDECAACGRRPSNVHHVVPKGAPHFGDDVEANFVLLCGTGTSGCHGAFHGNPYRHVTRDVPGSFAYERRDREWVARRIGETISATRPDTVSYVIEKLGDGPGRDYLRRRYLLEVCDEPERQKPQERQTAGD